MRRFIKFWMPAYLYAGFIFYISSIPRIPDMRIPNIDKSIHALEYSILAILLARAFRNAAGAAAAANFSMLAIAAGILYGASDEFHQLFVAGRNADPVDLIFDSVGVLIGVIIYRKIIYARDNTVPGRKI